MKAYYHIISGKLYWSEAETLYQYIERVRAAYGSLHGVSEYGSLTKEKAAMHRMDSRFVATLR